MNATSTQTTVTQMQIARTLRGRTSVPANLVIHGMAPTAICTTWSHCSFLCKAIMMEVVMSSRHYKARHQSPALGNARKSHYVEGSTPLLEDKPMGDVTWKLRTFMPILMTWQQMMQRTIMPLLVSLSLFGCVSLTLNSISISISIRLYKLAACGLLMVVYEAYCGVLVLVPA